MKKIFAIALCVMMLCAAVLPMTVSAAGIILMQDDFHEENWDNWVYDGTRFEVIDGRLEGYTPAVVHQSNNTETYEGHMEWNSGICFSVDMWMMDDDAGNGTPWAGLWWCDYMRMFADDEDHDGRIVYYLIYCEEDHTIRFQSCYEGDEASSYKPAEAEDESTYVWYSQEIPDAMDLSNPTKLNLGVRMDQGIIDIYFNAKKVFSMPAERGTACAAGQPTPIILWNNGSYVAFDNFVCATANYNLFNEAEIHMGPDAPTTDAPSTEPGQTEAPVTKAPDTTKIEEVVVTEIGDDGEVVTKIETVIVTNAPTPDTQKNPTNPQGGAQTGDMAVIVIAVMAVALGAAVVVKKVND